MPTAFQGPTLVVCDREVPGVLNMLKIYRVVWKERVQAF